MYAYLTTHNSYAIEGEPSHTGVPRVTFTNQEDTVTQQLNVHFSELESPYSKFTSEFIDYIYLYSFSMLSSILIRAIILLNVQNGARALMLDTYDFDDDVWLCHSSGGKCHDVTAFVSISISMHIKISPYIILAVDFFLLVHEHPFSS